MKSRNKNAKLDYASFVTAIIEAENSDAKGKSAAGRSGKMFEHVVCALKQLGFERYTNKEYEELSIEKRLPNRYIICNVPYFSLLKKKAEEYGIKRRAGSCRTEFVIVANDAISTEEFPTNGEPLKIRVECKWQGGPGTTQKKLAHTVIDLQYGGSLENNAILLMDGAGFDEAMHLLISELCEDGVSWKRAPEVEPKRIRKMRLNDFADWATAAFGNG